MLALAELIRLQMKAETSGVTTAMEVRRAVMPWPMQPKLIIPPAVPRERKAAAAESRDTGPVLGKGGGERRPYSMRQTVHDVFCSSSFTSIC